MARRARPAPAARRRAARRPAAISRRASERETPNAASSTAGRWTGPPSTATLTSGDLVGRLVLDEDAVEVRLGRRGGVRAVEALDDRARQRALGVARRGPAGGARSPSSSRYHVAIASSGSRIVLPYISSGGSVTPMWLPSDLDIFSAPSVPGRIGIVSIACSGWPYARWMSRAEQQVERLVGARRARRRRRRRPSRSPAAADTAARGPRSARRPRSAWRSRRARASARRSSCAPARKSSSIAHVEPLAVAAHLEALGVVAQDLEGLLLVGPRVGVDLLAARAAAASSSARSGRRRARCSRR